MPPLGLRSQETWVERWSSPRSSRQVLFKRMVINVIRKQLTEQTLVGGGASLTLFLSFSLSLFLSFSLSLSPVICLTCKFPGKVAADEFADQLRKRIDARIYEPGMLLTAPQLAKGRI